MLTFDSSLVAMAVTCVQRIHDLVGCRLDRARRLYPTSGSLLADRTSMSDRKIGRRGVRTLGWLGSMLLGLLLFGTAWAQTPDRVLTVAVLVNSTNTTGFSTNPLTPGEFQRYPERYLEHLQVPYQLLDVSAGAPP